MNPFDSAVDLAAAVRHRELSPVEIVDNIQKAPDDIPRCALLDLVTLTLYPFSIIGELGQRSLPAVQILI